LSCRTFVSGREPPDEPHSPEAQLLAEGLKENRCERCGLSEWRGKPLAVALHHANGNGMDNRIENLVMLCPNCHSQTENFAGRGRRRLTVVG
jgi:HNH endonuclease